MRQAAAHGHGYEHGRTRLEGGRGKRVEPAMPIPAMTLVHLQILWLRGRIGVADHENDNVVVVGHSVDAIDDSSMTHVSHDQPSLFKYFTSCAGSP